MLRGLFIKIEIKQWCGRLCRFERERPKLGGYLRYGEEAAENWELIPLIRKAGLN